MYKAVIFDLDGTLFDTLPDIQKVLNSTLEKFNLPALERERVMRSIGGGARELVRLAIGESNAYRLDEILAVYRAEYALNDGSLSRFFEGEEQTLSLLKEKNIKLAVFTNKPHSVALATCEKYFSRFSFDYILGQTDDLPLKPAPDGVYKILKFLGVEKDGCLFVGDGETDYLTAKNAEVDCVCALWGYRTMEQLKCVGAQKFADSFSRLADIILE